MTLAEVSPSVRAAPTLPSALLTPEVRAEGTRTVITLRGEADSSTRPVMFDVLSGVVATGTGDVVVDLAELKFIDTATVRVLAVAQQILDRRGRGMTFRSPSRLAVLMLAVSGLTHLVEARAVANP